MHKIDEPFANRNLQLNKQQQANKQSSQKKPIKDRICINAADTQYAVVKSVAKKLKWNIIYDPLSQLNFDIVWTDNHVRQEIFARMQEHQKINHFPGMTILSRKNNLGKNLMAFRRQFPGQFDFFPITWTLPYEFSDLKQYNENRKQGKAQTFIVKPQASCQGRGIFLTRNIERLKYQKCVVQRYMHKPFLIDGLKFDLRIYVLVAGIDPLRIYVYQDGLVRFSTEQYCPPKSDNLDNRFMHLTNYAINKQHPDFIFNQNYEDGNVGHKRSLKAVYQMLQKEGHNIKQLKQKINDIFVKTLITGYPVLSRTLHQVHPDNFANDMCFEVLGFDIMLDHKLNPYILEVNYTPSFTTDTPLDKHIKKNLILDSLEVVNLSSEWKSELRKRREKDIQERMMTGKRKKFTFEQRKKLTQEAILKRNQHENNCESIKSGRFTKIFMKKDMIGLGEYKKFYEFAQEIYEEEHSTHGISSNPIYPLFKLYSEGTKNNTSNSILKQAASGKNVQSKMRSSYQGNQASAQKAKTVLNNSNLMENDKKSVGRGCESAQSQGRKVNSAKGKQGQKALALNQKSNQSEIEKLYKKQQSPTQNLKKNRAPKSKKHQEVRANSQISDLKQQEHSDRIHQNQLNQYEDIVFNNPNLKSVLIKNKSYKDTNTNKLRQQ